MQRRIPRVPITYVLNADRSNPSKLQPRVRGRNPGLIAHLANRGVASSFVILTDAGGAIGGSPASLWLYVEGCDSLFNRAVTAGAQIAQGGMGKMQDQFWGDRSGTIVDPHQYTWTIATHKEDLTPEEMRQRQDAFMKQFAASASR